MKTFLVLLGAQTFKDVNLDEPHIVLEQVEKLEKDLLTK